MTVGEFDTTGWTGRMMAKYAGTEWLVSSCDFEDKTVGLIPVVDRGKSEIMVDCSRVTILNKIAPLRN